MVDIAPLACSLPFRMCDFEDGLSDIVIASADAIAI